MSTVLWANHLHLDTVTSDESDKYALHRHLDVNPGQGENSIIPEDGRPLRYSSRPTGRNAAENQGCRCARNGPRPRMGRKPEDHRQNAVR